MRVRIWGTRGSIATAGPETVRYGGNTACVDLRADDRTLLIFDCGTGARKLGNTLAQAGPVTAHLFVSHTHADHIQGLPFFLPAFNPGSRLTVYGPAGIDRSLPGAVGGQMDYAYFPVPLEDLPATVDFVELGETDFAIGGVVVRSHFLNHTAPCLGYRVTAGGATFVYATDHEAHASPPWRADRQPGAFDPALLVHRGDERHAEFLAGADVVLHDAQYTAADYPAKAGWGHSTVEYAVDIALAAEAERLILFHHDPARDDAAVDALLQLAHERVQMSGLSLDVRAAAEGDEVLIDEPEVETVRERAPAKAPVVDRARVLVADDDVDVVQVLKAVLAGDGYQIDAARDGREALAKAAATPYDLFLVDIHMPGTDGVEVCRRLRADARYRATPVVIITALTRHEDMVDAFAAGVTDYIRKPFAVSQVRARVHSWLSRSAAG